MKKKKYSRELTPDEEIVINTIIGVYYRAGCSQEEIDRQKDIMIREKIGEITEEQAARESLGERVFKECYPNGFVPEDFVQSTIEWQKQFKNKK